jgi:predicted Fe-S protein YdhL (DUF1289 family)
MTDDVDSGCIGVCSTLFDPVCKGCGRTQQEVDNWVFMTNEELQAAVDRAAKEGTAVRFNKQCSQ